MFQCVFFWSIQTNYRCFHLYCGVLDGRKHVCSVCVFQHACRSDLQTNCSKKKTEWQAGSQMMMMMMAWLRAERRSLERRSCWWRKDTSFTGWHFSRVAAPFFRDGNGILGKRCVTGEDDLTAICALFFFHTLFVWSFFVSRSWKYAKDVFVRVTFR